MEQEFRNWLRQRGKPGAANSYPSAIPNISEHYSRSTGESVDIYAITDQSKISQIAHDYSQAGRFSAFGYEQHSRYRAAIARYSEFFVQRFEISTSQEVEITTIGSAHLVNTETPQTNFAYEKDLQTTLCAQISELFPGYKIFGESNLGIEYFIGGRRIDVLLENVSSGALLAVELKSGVADYKVFGQISMYIGLLKNQFPEKSISGVIVAGAIDDSLKQACAITDKVLLKVYRMSIELEEA
jgi:RecB family endonuclease NucS